MAASTIAISALAVSATSAGVSAYGSYASAKAQNEANERYQQRGAEATAQAVQVGTQQVQAQAQLQKAKRLNESHMLVSRLRVAAGEMGVGMGGSYGALVRQADYDTEMNRRIIDRNAEMQIARIRSGGTAQLAQLAGGLRQNPILAAFASGLQGAAAGLQIGTGVQSLFPAGAAAGASEKLAAGLLPTESAWTAGIGIA